MSVLVRVSLWFRDRVRVRVKVRVSFRLGLGLGFCRKEMCHIVVVLRDMVKG